MRKKREKVGKENEREKRRDQRMKKVGKTDEKRAEGGEEICQR